MRYIEWLGWLVSVGAVGWTLLGFGRLSVGHNTENPHLAARGRRTVVSGIALAVTSATASTLARTWGGPGSGTSSGKPAPNATGGGASEWLLWGGLGLGGVLAVLLGAWGLTRLGRRRAAKRRLAEAARVRWAALESDHDAVATAYGDYLGDSLEWLDRPALSDVAVPQTETLLHALDAAADARRGGDVDRYQQSVAVLKTAWRAADDHARRSGLAHLSASERRSVEQARKLLTTALDAGTGSEHERRTAYAKARALLDGVLVIPQQATEALEIRHRLALAPETS